MSERSNNQSETGGLSERDKAIFQVFVTLISSTSLAYAINYSDLYVAFLGIVALLLTYVILTSSSESTLKPLERFANPVEEAGLSLSFYFTYAWIIFPFIRESGLFIKIGLLVLIGIIPITLILLRGCNYSHTSLGLKNETPSSGMNLLCIVILGLTVGLFIRIIPNFVHIQRLISPEGITIFLYYSVFSGLAIGFAEEYVFRGIVQPRISQYFRSRVMGVVATSTLFAILHFVSWYNAKPVGLDPIAAIFYALLTRLTLGIVFGVLWLLSENLALPWMAHALNNAYYGIMLILEAI